MRGLGRTYVCAKYSSYCCKTCGFASASTQEQGVISDLKPNDKSTSEKKTGVNKKEVTSSGQIEENLRHNNKDKTKTVQDVNANRDKPSGKNNQLLNLFQKALKGLNQFLSSAV